MNDGTYTFALLDRLVFPDAIISLWSSLDMIALKLMADALYNAMKDHLPHTCYHVKGHGGLKLGVKDTQIALSQHEFVMRSDIKGYYESIRFDRLMEILRQHVDNPVLLRLIYVALRRTETTGGNFYEFDIKGLPKGSPLSPILGAIALMPLDQAMAGYRDVFYGRYMDDFIMLTKTKTMLRKWMSDVGCRISENSRLLP